MKDIVIIGGGPAGLTSAIYGSRAGYKVTLISKGAPGGKMQNTSEVENYPGTGTITGSDLSMSMYEQAISFGTEILYNTVVEVNAEKQVILDDGKIIDAKTIIIATGLRPRKLEIPTYEKWFGKGLSTCFVCDGALYKGKDVLFVGAGVSSMEEAIYGHGLVDNITILNRGSDKDLDTLLKSKIDNIENIKIISDATIIDIVGDSNIEAVKVNVSGKETEIKTSSVFSYIGFESDLEVFSKLELEVTANLINTNESMETSFDSVYATGDIRNKKFKQISIAVSDGTIAAMSAIEKLNE